MELFGAHEATIDCQATGIILQQFLLQMNAVATRRTDIESDERLRTQLRTSDMRRKKK